MRLVSVFLLFTKIILIMKKAKYTVGREIIQKSNSHDTYPQRICLGEGDVTSTEFVVKVRARLIRFFNLPVIRDELHISDTCESRTLN